jgi:hypothetical protein
VARKFERAHRCKCRAPREEPVRKNRRLGYFIVAVVALGLPGPDPMTTALELLPM